MEPTTQDATQIQSEAMQALAYNVGCNELQAYVCSLQVVKSLTVKVSNRMFTTLVTLCNKIGAPQFKNSLVLLMVNTNQSQAKIKAELLRIFSEPNKAIIPPFAPLLNVA